MGGIYLGMTEEELLHYYGKPDSRTQDNGMVRWEYKADRFAVIFKGNIVVEVRLYAGCDRHFDRSGLGAADAPSLCREIWHSGGAGCAQHGRTAFPYMLRLVPGIYFLYG